MDVCCSNKYVRPATGQFTVTDVVPTATGDPSKLKVKARLNIHGVFSVVTATLYEKLAEPVETEGNGQEKEAEGMEDQTGGKGPEKKDQPTGAEAKGDDASQKEGSQVDGETSMEADGKPEAGAPKDDRGESGPQQEGNAAAGEETQSSQDPSAKNGGDNSGDKSTVAKKRKKTVKAIDLAVTAWTASASREELDCAREEEVCLVRAVLCLPLYTSPPIYSLSAALAYVIVPIFLLRLSYSSPPLFINSARCRPMIVWRPTKLL